MFAAREGAMSFVNVSYMLHRIMHLDITKKNQRKRGSVLLVTLIGPFYLASNWGLTNIKRAWGTEQLGLVVDYVLWNTDPLARKILATVSETFEHDGAGLFT